MNVNRRDFDQVISQYIESVSAAVNNVVRGDGRVNRRQQQALDNALVQLGDDIAPGLLRRGAHMNPQPVRVGDNLLSVVNHVTLNRASEAMFNITRILRDAPDQASNVDLIAAFHAIQSDASRFIAQEVSASGNVDAVRSQLLLHDYLAQNVSHAIADHNARFPREQNHIDPNFALDPSVVNANFNRDLDAVIDDAINMRVVRRRNRRGRQPNPPPDDDQESAAAINSHIRKDIRANLNRSGLPTVAIRGLHDAFNSLESDLIDSSILSSNSFRSTIPQIRSLLHAPIPARHQILLNTVVFNLGVRPLIDRGGDLQGQRVLQLERGLTSSFDGYTWAQLRDVIDNRYFNPFNFGSGENRLASDYELANNIRDRDARGFYRFVAMQQNREFSFELRVNPALRYYRGERGDDERYGWNVNTSHTSVEFNIAGTNDLCLVFNCAPNVRDAKSAHKSPNCVIIALNLVLANRLLFAYGVDYCRQIRDELKLNQTDFLNLDMFVTLYDKYKDIPYPTNLVPSDSHAYTDKNSSTILMSRELAPFSLVNSDTALCITPEFTTVLQEFVTGRRDIVVCSHGHMGVTQSVQFREYTKKGAKKRFHPVSFNAQGDLIYPNVISSIPSRVRQNRSFMFYDFETYNDSQTSLSSSKTILRDTICHIGFDRADERDRAIYKAFTTTFDTTKSTYHTSARKLLDYLADERVCPTKFVAIAHNAANFDHYFLLMSMTDVELSEVLLNGIVKIGSSILQFEYKGHKFIDSCKFLTNTLSNVCKAYLADKPDLWKTTQVSFTEPGSVIPISMSSTELCFYKADENLPFRDFINLQSEPARPDHRRFWDVYNEYCKQDVVALKMVWTRFNSAVDTLLNNLATYPALFPGSIDKSTLMKKGSLMTAITTGNHHMSILKALNHSNPLWEEVMRACPSDFTLNRLVNMYKIGGMSISHQKGLFNTPLIAYDIKSLYPSSLLYGIYPAGVCKRVELGNLDPRAPAIFQLENLVFDVRRIHPKFHIKALNPDSTNIYTLRPILEQCDTAKSQLNNDFYLTSDERTWYSNIECVKKTCASSIALDYMQQFMGLVSFQIVDGVQWEHYVHGSSIFGNHILSCYMIKDEEDKKKAANDPSYNSARREAVKLGMNALTGKLGQSPLRGEDLMLKPSHVNINHELHTDVARKVQVVSAGSSLRTNATDMSLYMIYIYEHSKLTMFSYLRHLPNGYDDLIAIETDSIHTFSSARIMFENSINDVSSETVVANKTYLLQIPDIYATHLKDRNSAPFVHNPTNAVLPHSMYNEEGCFTIKLFPNFEAGDNVTMLGTLAVDKLADKGIYISKKKYALFKAGWSFRLSGLKPTTTLPDGKVVSVLNINTFLDILHASVKYQESVLVNTATSDELKSLRHEMKTSQNTSHLSKDPSRLLVHATRVTKSVSPVVGVILVDPEYEQYTPDTFCNIIDSMRE